MVVVVTVVVAGQYGAPGRVVVGALDATADLHAIATERQLLVAEGGERGLLGARRQRLGAERFEVADLYLGAEPARDVLQLPLIDQRARDVGPVVEPRVDVLDAADGVDVVVVQVDRDEGGADPLDDAVVEVAQADVEAAHATLDARSISISSSPCTSAFSP